MLTSILQLDNLTKGVVDQIKVLMVEIATNAGFFSGRNGELCSTQASEMIEDLHLVRPSDRNGKLVLDRWSSPALEEALNAYRKACMLATDGVRQILRNLSLSLQVCCAAQFTMMGIPYVIHGGSAFCCRMLTASPLVCRQICNRL